MTSGSHDRADNASARQNRVADLSDVVVRLPERGEAAAQVPVIRVGNVIPFAPVRRDAAAAHPAPEVAPKSAERPAPLLTDRQRNLFLAFVLVSLVCHGSFYFLFSREPPPMASIGLEAITVELVLGANSPAGVAQTPGQSAATNTPADAPDPVPADTQTATATPETVKEAKPVETARTVMAEVTPREAKPEQPRAVTATETPVQRTEPATQPTAALRVEETSAAQELELTVLPEVAPEPKPADPDRPQPTPVETKPEPPPKPKAVETREPKRKTEPAKRKQERPGPVSRTASTTPDGDGRRAVGASGVGIGRSYASSDYSGLVVAHLKRYQRNNQTAQGSVMVAFGLDGGGRVTRVSLARGSGDAGLDQEAQAMVHRASPFPAPPDRAAKSFTVPVRFVR